MDHHTLAQFLRCVLQKKHDFMVQVFSSYNVEPQIIEITTAPFIWFFETVHHGDPLMAK